MSRDHDAPRPDPGAAGRASEPDGARGAERSGRRGGTREGRRSRVSRRDALRAGVAGIGLVGAGCLSRDGSAATRATTTGADRGDEATATARRTERDETPDTSDMELVLEDHFAGDELDTSVWYDKYPWDSRTHNYDGYAAPENVYIEDDKLVLLGEDRPTADREYTTGVVSGKEVFEPGYFEASIEIPPIVPGFWPAYWLTSASQHPPEIDVFEFYDNEHVAHMTYHYADSDGEEHKVRETWGGIDFSADFHTYSVDWDPPEKIVWYIDGVERFRYDGPHVSDEYCYLILNFGLDRPGHPPPRSEDLPATYEVDWIRCWER